MLNFEEFDDNETTESNGTFINPVLGGHLVFSMKEQQ